MSVNSTSAVEATGESLAARFRRLREGAGLKQSDVAEPLCTVSFVSQIENGRRTPGREALEHFARRLGVSPSYLRTGIPDDLVQQLAFRIEEARSGLREGAFDRATEVGREVSEEAFSYGLVETRARALVLWGDALLLAGRAREAIDPYEGALEGGLTDRERGLATASLATAYRSVGDLAYAADLVESTLRALRHAPLDPAVAAELHSVLVSIYFERGDITRAERVARQALEAATEGVSPYTRSNVLWSAARVLAERNRFEEALELSREARQIIESLDDRLRLARVHVAYAFLCAESDPARLEEGAAHLEEATTLFGTDAPSHELAYLHIERGRLALLQGDAEQALSEAELAVPLSEGDPIEGGRALFLRGRARAELGRRKDALDDFNEAAATFEKAGARQQVASCYREVGEIELGAGDLGGAVEAFRRGLDALEPRHSRA